MATITISHYIFLTREQRYSLNSGEQIDVIGVSVPVWFNKGTTSEPAKEVFCKYKLTNEKINKSINFVDNCYNINLLHQIEGEEDFDGGSEKLLDVEDGGSEYIDFREYNKIVYENKQFDIVHFVEIKTIETLIETLS